MGVQGRGPNDRTRWYHAVGAVGVLLVVAAMLTRGMYVLLELVQIANRANG